MQPNSHPVRWICALTVLALLALPVCAQAAGKIAGQVLNGMTGSPAPGVTIVIEGTEVETTTDPNGMFRTGDLPSGTYTIQVSGDAWETQRVTDVVVTDNATANFAAVVMPAGDAVADTDSQTTISETITVEAAADQSTETALLAERKAAAQISDSIGTEEIGKTTGSDAAGVLQRVTGISLQDNKFVFVRGLGERYSNTTLNGSKIPTTEFEKKVVPLDLFPTSLIDKITVSKSYTVDKPGDFAAGFVELRTLEFPTQQQGEVGVSVGYNSVTTGDPFLEYGDGLSFSGSGGQSLPSTIPSDPLLRESPLRPGGFDRAELEAFGEELVGLWSPSSGSDAPYDTSAKASYGNTFGNFGLVLSANYDNDYTTRNEVQNIFGLAAGQVIPQNTYEVDFGVEKVRQSFVANLAYQLSPNNQIKLRSLYTDLSETEGRVQEGFFQDLSSNIRDFRVSYQNQEIFNSQLSAEHFLPSVGVAGSLLEWKASFSTANTDENRRETIYEEQREGQFVLTDNAQSGFLYFNDLEDEILDGSADWTTFLSTDRFHGSVRGGLAYTNNERAFDGRRLRFDHKGTFGLDLTLPADQLFTDENIGTAFEVEEVTRATDTYDGSQDIVAAYAQVDLGWGEWRLIGGLRAEDSQIEVITLDRNNPAFTPIVTELDDTDLLPALSLVYQLTADQNLRFAASQTVNRPVFQELAPFQYIHIVGGFEVRGNPALESAGITSTDLRWEWFPGTGEVVAASLFYKDFDNPIELVEVSGANRIETYQNVEAARNWGAEVEFRRSLGSFWEGLEEFTAVVNYTYVDSQLEIDPANTNLTNPTRPLTGQPDNVANVVLEWGRPTWGSGVRLLYNFTGDKVYRGGTFGVPDVIEDGRGTLDLVYRQELLFYDGLSFKLSGTNLTDEEWLWTQGGETFRAYDPGRSFSMSFSLDLF